MMQRVFGRVGLHGAVRGMHGCHAVRSMAVVVKREADIDEKFRLAVVHGDITEETSDAIVNAANGMLRHGGGVARAIADAAGAKIWEESRARVKENGGEPFAVGTVAVTTPGLLDKKSGGKIKHVIHAVAPDCREPEFGDDEELRSAEMHLAQAMRNSLRTAEMLGCSSVALPAMASGIFEFPKPRCAEVLVDTTVSFLRDPSPLEHLKEIRFTNVDQETVDEFLRVFTDRFGPAPEQETDKAGEEETAGEQEETQETEGAKTAEEKEQDKAASK